MKTSTLIKSAKKGFILAAGSFLLAGPLAQSAVDLDYDLDAKELTITFTEAVDFTVDPTAAAGEYSIISLVFDDIYQTGDLTTGSIFPVGTPTLTLQNDDFTPEELDFGGFQRTGNGVIETTDLVLSFDTGGPITVSNPGVLTISAGTVVSGTGLAPFNETLPKPDNIGGVVNLFLVDPSSNWAQISNDVMVAVVPEPGLTSLVLSGLLGLGIVIVRRRRR